MAHQTDKDITAHYGSDNLGKKIFDALGRAGKDIASLQLKDLSVIDQLHTGGHLATLDLARRAGLSKGMMLMDAGCGIGGSSRLLAHHFHCTVTGVDLVTSFVDVAKELSRCTATADQKAGGTELPTFICGSILETGLPNEAFDVVWCQHTLMNIRDKSAAFAEFKRILKPGGLMVLHEIVRGTNAGLHLPVPWADRPEISFLLPRQELEAFILEAGFVPQFMEDRTDQAKLWWEKVKSATLKTADAPPRPLGPHIVFGNNGRLFGQTMTRNLHEACIGLIEGIYIA